MANPTPLVLLADEIDSLVGDTLLSVLRQIRAGYEQGVEQTLGSMAKCEAQERHLVIVDRRSEERRRREGVTAAEGHRADGRAVVVWTV